MTDIMPVTGYLIPEQCIPAPLPAPVRTAPKYIFTRLEWAQHATAFGLLSMLGLTPAGKIFPTVTLVIVPAGILLLILSSYLYATSFVSWRRSRRSN